MYKQKSKSNKSKIIKFSIIFILAILIFLLAYKSLLLFNVKSLNKNIDSFLATKEGIIGKDIIINHQDSEELITYKDLLITSNIGNKENIKNGIKFNNNDKIIIIMESKPYIKELNLKGTEKYLKLENIETDEDIHNFVYNFKKKKVNIFTPIKNIKMELFRRNFFVIVYSTWNEYHLIKGDVTGFVEKFNNNNRITYTIHNKNKDYIILFNNYDLDETIDIINTVSIKEDFE